MLKIKVLRKAAGIKQVNLAKTLGVGQPSLCAWETGKAQPTADKLPTLAKALGCTIDDLFEKDGD
mgnify:FL=1